MERLNIVPVLPAVTSSTLNSEGRGISDICEDSSKNIEFSSPTSLSVCRLCAFGTLDSEDKYDKWIALSKTFMDSKDTVAMILQKCLPDVIMMVTLPLDFPQLICESCLKNLQLTKEFFDKITEGQNIIAQLIKKFSRVIDQGSGALNQINVSLIPSQSETALKRKRGRPKKALSNTGSKVHWKDGDGNVSVNEEPRSKRSTRPPCRYSSEVFESGKSKDEISEQANEITVTEEESSKITNPDVEKNEGEANPSANEDDTESVKSDADDKSVKLSTLLRGSHSTKRRKRGRPKLRKKQVDFRCELCEKQYSSQSSLVYHRLSAHDTRRDFQCTICKKSFSHKGLLTNHMFTHYSEKYFTCDEPGCISSYKSRASLYTHKRSAHFHNSTKEFTCEKCGGQFTLKSSLNAHMRLHTGEKPFVCKYCGKSFNHRGNMKEHIRTHTKEKPYACDGGECEKRFATLSQLKIHKLTHSGSKPYLCVTCGKGFTFPDNLRCHMKRHSGEKSEECPICHKQFTDACTLRKHKRVHTGEKPYECTVCQKTFSDPSNFAKHKKIHVPSLIQSVSEEVVPGQSVIVATDNIQSVSEPTILHDSGSPNDVDACSKGAVQVSDQSLVDILTTEAFAALSDGSSVAGPNIIYLYESTDIFPGAGEEQSFEVTVGESQTVAIHEVIETFSSQDVTFGIGTESDNGNQDALSSLPSVNCIDETH
ncbi:unnamed protein product [Orchesella dallaii]|uniref:Zinc finger protein n=1 Tax=Orchesella dallaii TaxID=48710 RepID=A0ABP1Q2Q3_9HEXA